VSTGAKQICVRLVILESLSVECRAVLRRFVLKKRIALRNVDAATEERSEGEGLPT